MCETSFNNLHEIKYLKKAFWPKLPFLGLGVVIFAT
jgi:hypothetical protein